MQSEYLAITQNCIDLFRGRPILRIPEIDEKAEHPMHFVVLQYICNSK